CGNEPNLISVDEAFKKIATSVQPLATEKRPIVDCLNRVLAQDVQAIVDLPIFSQSAVDGYALCCASEVEVGQQFRLIGEIRAGQVVDHELQQGQALRIFTGGKIPQGTTTIARQEIVARLDEQTIELTQKLALDADIRHVAEEVRQGEVLAQHGQRMTVGTIAALSMAGIQQLTVYRQPKCAVLVTGDEIAVNTASGSSQNVDQNIARLAQGKVFDANTPMLKAWFQQQQLEAEFFHVADEFEQVTACLQQLQQQFDVIITTGGVSVGDYDFIRPAALQIGFEGVFWKVRQKPGKPLFFARYARQMSCNDDAPSACYLLGLPGNPAAVYIGAYLYVAAICKALQGQTIQPTWFQASLTNNLKADARERFLRMSVKMEQGQLHVTPLGKQQSHMLSNLSHAQAIVRIPATLELQAGQWVHGFFIE
ncbi:MAG: molybdopterin molybdotransferase MoeA, partial [Acinetobacter sp.]